MRALGQWFAARSPSWGGLRWAAAGLSLAAHGAAASLAWVMIEAEPPRAGKAFTVEIVAVDPREGAHEAKPSVSAAVPVDRADTAVKTDTAAGAEAAAASEAPASEFEIEVEAEAEAEIEPAPQPVRTATAVPEPEPQPKPEPERESAAPALMEAPADDAPVFQAAPPKPRVSKRGVSRDPTKETIPVPPEKPAEEIAETAERFSKNDREPQVARLAPMKSTHGTEDVQKKSAPSTPGMPGSGAEDNPAEGEAVPLTAASYTAGALGNRPPEYPPRARRNAFEGRVVLRVTVTPAGTGESVAVIESSGYRVLDDAARAAVEEWRFVPAKRAGVAVTATLDVPIVFRLTAPPR